MATFLVRQMSNPEPFFTRYDPAAMAERFDASQYGAGPRAGLLILSDGDVFAYAGWRYLQGADASAIRDAHPPLGKYLIGLSILATGSQDVGSLVAGTVGLAAFALLALRLTGSRAAAVVATALLSVDAAYWDASRDSLLDVYFFLSAVGSLLVFVSAIEHPTARWWYALGVLLGVSLAIKWFAVYLIVALGLFAWTHPAHGDRVFTARRAGLALAVATITYVLSFAALFAHGKGPLDFLQLHAAMLGLLGHGTLTIRYPPLMIWPYWLGGWYLIWWPPYGFHPAPDWSALWPVTAALALVGGRLVWRRPDPTGRVAVFWLLSNLAFRSVGAVFPRYLLLLVAPADLLAAPALVAVGASVWRRLFARPPSDQPGRSRRWTAASDRPASDGDSERPPKEAETP